MNPAGAAGLGKAGQAVVGEDLARHQGDPAHVVNFMRFIAQEMRELMAQLGFRTVNEMIGRTDLLESREAIDHWKARGLDFTNILYQPKAPDDVGRYCQIPQDHGLDKALDNTTLLALCKPALERGEKVTASLEIKNVNRVVGTILGSELTRRHGVKGLPEDTVKIHFKGSAGQSFGAFVPRGMTMRLFGDLFRPGLCSAQYLSNAALNSVALSSDNHSPVSRTGRGPWGASSVAAIIASISAIALVFRSRHDEWIIALPGCLNLPCAKGAPSSNQK